MAHSTNRLVKNSKRRKCKGCEGEHDYITALSKDAPCSTPVAFSIEKAGQIANLHASGADDVVEIPEDDMVVILDDSARKLPRGASTTLAHYTNIVQAA